MIPRRPTRKVTLGDDAHGFVSIGGDAPVSVQTMTAGYTYEIEGEPGEYESPLTGTNPGILVNLTRVS